MLDDQPLAYHKMSGMSSGGGGGSMSMGYPYSPAHGGMLAGGGGRPSPAGYRTSAYGLMPLTPRAAGGGGMGGMGMGGMSLTPTRSASINRRFMEPIDGYIYQVSTLRMQM